MSAAPLGHNSVRRLDPRAKIAGAFGIAFGFFAGTGVSGLAMSLGIAGLWGLIYGLSAQGKPLDQAFVKALKKHGETWLCLSLFALWVLSTSLWSPAPALAEETVRRLAAVCVLAPIGIWAVYACRGEDRLLAQRAIIAGVFLSLGIQASEAISHYAMNRFASPEKEPLEIAGDMGRAASATLTLFWVAYACLYQQMSDARIRFALVGLAIFVSLQFGTDINAVGMVLGTLAALFALSFPRTALALVSGGAATLIAAAPLIYPALANLAFKLLPGDKMPLSYGRRAQMWETASGYVTQKPLTGWGLGAGSTFDTPIMYGGFEWPIIQLHPHAAPMHIWLETGGIGALLASVTIVLAGGVAIRVFGRHRIATSALVGGLTFLALNWGFSHSAWREWVWTSFAALIAFSFMLRNSRRWASTLRARRVD
ncbi:O-antigen ligase family protein [Aquidulcibacter paucihalophilus]|uniref:O-antigen ligase family protein n=1 Tax=Aquidulcibacter paucihalophilus TaxID=1978549 RepID=UPI000A18D0F5|nr:O-antigen ligase family protein [Aquidulcibacter paucihalophilus]